MVENKESFNLKKHLTLSGVEQVAAIIGTKKIKPKEKLVEEVQKILDEKKLGLKIVPLRKEKRLETGKKKEALPEVHNDEEEDLDDIRKLEKELRAREKKEGKNPEGYKIYVRKLIILLNEVSKARIVLSSKVRAHLRKLREGAPHNEIEKLRKEAVEVEGNLRRIIRELNRVKNEVKKNDKYKNKFKYLTVYKDPI